MVLRLVNLTAPPIGMHGWRQSDTASIARNFYENGYKFGLPEVDWGGASVGYVESEFPIFPFTVAVAYSVLGVHEWIGRFLAGSAFVVGALAFYGLIRRVMDTPTAIWSLGFYLLLPLGVFYSRAFMPESWMLTSSVLGVYWFYRWTDSGRTVHLLLTGVFITLAALIKLPALYLGLPLAWMAWNKFGRQMFRERALWLSVAAILVSVAAWYYHAHEILMNGGLTFRIWEYGSDKWGNWNLVTSWTFWNAILFRSVAERWFTWAAFAVLLFGLALPRRGTGERLFDAWLVAVLIYFVIVARGNYVHEYYQLPLLPVGAAFLGKVFARYWGSTWRSVPRRLLAASLVVTLALSAIRIANYLSREDPRRSSEVILARELRALTEPEARIITLQGGNPTLLYLAHRKGWTISPPALDRGSLETMRRSGAQYIAATGTSRITAASGLTQRDMSAIETIYRTRHGLICRL